MATEKDKIDLEATAEAASVIFDDMVDKVEGYEGDEKQSGLYYLLWIRLTRVLVSAGFTDKELTGDLRFHAKLQRVEDTVAPRES